MFFFLLLLLLWLISSKFDLKKKFLYGIFSRFCFFPFDLIRKKLLLFIFCPNKINKHSSILTFIHMFGFWVCIWKIWPPQFFVFSSTDFFWFYRLSSIKWYWGNSQDIEISNHFHKRSHFFLKTLFIYFSNFCIQLFFGCSLSILIWPNLKKAKNFLVLNRSKLEQTW